MIPIQKRRETLEKHLAEVGFSERISMRRFSGIIPTPQQVEHFKEHLPGVLPGHMGRFLSHKAVLEQKLANDDGENDLLVVEDDTQFSPRTEFFLDRAFDRLRGQEWDLLYTDFIVETQQEKFAFYEIRLIDRTDKILMLDLKNHSFSGTSCYIVNRTSLSKYKTILDELNPVDKLIDRHIKEQVHAGRLLARAVFPFISTITSEANLSSIDGQVPLAHYNNFIRRHLWIDAPLC